MVHEIIMSHYMCQLTEKQRYEIIIRRDMNQSMRKIATEMNINLKTVLTWSNRYKNTNSIKRQIGSGRKCK